MNKWTIDDINILKLNHDKSLNELFELLEHKHSLSSIQTKKNRLGFSSRSFWSDEEIKLLKQGYQKSIDKACELLPHRTRVAICHQALKLNLDKPEVYQYDWSKEEDDYIKANWILMSDIILAQKLCRTFRSVKWRRELLGCYRQDKNEKNYRLLSRYLRFKSRPWVKKIKCQYNNQCFLTGSTNIDLHHYYSVNIIIKNILQELNLNTNGNFSDYTEDQLNLIWNKFKIIQEQNGGVCIDKKIHTLFHRVYGFDNTKEQFDQFCSDYKLGYYDEYLLESA